MEVPPAQPNPDPAPRTRSAPHHVFRDCVHQHSLQRALEGPAMSLRWSAALLRSLPCPPHGPRCIAAHKGATQLLGS